MAKKYLAFLGTNKYLECCYEFQGIPMEPLRYVQEVTLKASFSDSAFEDKIVIFLTQKARERNWENDVHQPGLEGLRSRISGLGLNAEVVDVDIPDGHTEEEIWSIFNKIYEHLAHGDEVYFDITHAFRSIPMLAIVVLNYAKVLKEIRIKGIYYGAFEKLGGYKEVSDMPVEDRIAPVLDLTPLVLLLDWTIAIDGFLASGDAGRVKTLANEGVTPVLKASKGRDESAVAIRKLAEKLYTFTNIMMTCRGPEISTITLDLKEHLQKCEAIDMIQPFKPLFELIVNKLEGFSGEVVKDGVCAAKWCLEHNLIQQGYTILLEIIRSHFIAKIKGNHLDVEMREIVAQAEPIIRKNIVEKPDEWHLASQKNVDMTKQIIHIMENQTDFLKEIDKLSQKRNDLNHAGFKSCAIQGKYADDFRRTLQSLIDKFQSIL